MEKLTDEEKQFVQSKTNYYTVALKNEGGLVMPIILRFKFEDGSEMIKRLPAEAWVRNNKSTQTSIISEKILESVELDPYRETADTNRDNNYFPPRLEPSRFQIYKGEERRRSGGDNPMKAAQRREEERKKKAAEKEAAEKEAAKKEAADKAGGEGKEQPSAKADAEKENTQPAKPASDKKADDGPDTPAPKAQPGSGKPSAKAKPDDTGSSAAAAANGERRGRQAKRKKEAAGVEKAPPAKDPS
jgi:hypothetical protein